ncbi:MAG: SCP2 sterol-binding domain-containing protein [Micromonospora sp.]
MTVNDTNPALLEPREFARLVKRTPASELRRLMRGEQRTAVLDELFARMPGVFRPDRAGALSAVIHWRIGDRPDGGVDTYQLVIADGTCELSPRPDAEPALTLSLGAVEFLQLITGNAHPVMLVMRGRLKTAGDLGVTAKFPTLFDVPRP